MADQSKKHIKFYLLSLLGFYLVISLVSCEQQVEPEPLAAPELLSIEIITAAKPIWGALHRLYLKNL